MLRFLTPRFGPEWATKWACSDIGDVTVRRMQQPTTITSVLVAGFAVYQGKAVFQVLADRMDAAPGLQVTMYLNVDRKPHDVTVTSDLLREFAHRFRSQQWPGKRRPDVYYDVRALATHQPGVKRASLHAKCVVVDGHRSFVTSANFTEAAQDRNIEVGVLVESRAIASSIEEQFRRLVKRGILAALPP